MATNGGESFLISLLSDRERFYEQVVEGRELGAKLRLGLATMAVLGGFYGLVAGAYSGWAQAVATGIKLPVLLLATLLVCFPVFFVVQVLMGSRLKLLQVLVLVVSSLALMSILLAGLFGMVALHDGLAVICEKRGVYPRRALTMMRIWAVLFAFVGIQMAWNLRPFLSDRREAFQVIGKYQGNFYAAIVYAVNKLLTGEEKPVTPPQPRSLHDVFPQLPESVRDSLHRPPR